MSEITLTVNSPQFNPTRQKRDRRVLDRRGKSAAEVEIAAVCIAVGAKYVGIMLGTELPNGARTRTLVLFQCPRGSTCAVYANEFNEQSVVAKLIEAEKRFRDDVFSVDGAA